jgi:two-component system cell cycle response regulator
VASLVGTDVANIAAPTVKKGKEFMAGADGSYSRQKSVWRMSLDSPEEFEAGGSKVSSVADRIAVTTESPGTAITMDSVLVADDDAISLAMLASSLRKCQFNVITAKDGLYAWNEAQKKTAPNLIVLDWMMPGFSGIELCRKIRLRKTQPYPYILLLTSKDAKQDIVEGLDAGADDYLVKPLDANELQARLRVGKRILGLQQELMLKEQEMRAEALRDRLTGLWNRGAILDSMEREITLNRRSDNSSGVLMIDIDHFKSVNDTYGHQVGDAVLREVGQRLIQVTRSSDWAGRYGGEEFLVILCNSNAETTATGAERIRQAIASVPVRVSGLELAVTVSIGTALSATRDSLTCSQLIAIADSALYRAKNQGRNSVEVGSINHLIRSSV